MNTTRHLLTMLRAGLLALALLASLFAGALFSSVPTANAAGITTGPVNPDHGYPEWYQDENGLRLDLCLDGPPLCLSPDPAEDPGVDRQAPFVVAADPADSNFPGEAFWWTGEATMPLAGGGDALLVLAMEAAFGGADEAVRDGDQVSFGRVRVRVRSGLAAGATYRVTHPYGVDEHVAEAGQNGGTINATEDIGCAVDTRTRCNFDVAGEDSRIGPFLTWDTFETDGADQPPTGHVGDPNIPHRVTGSPLNQNVFRIERLNANGGVAEVLGETDLFAVQGKIATPRVRAVPRGGTFNQARQVELRTTDPDATIFYTLNGADPDATSTEYTGQPILIEQTTSLKAVAIAPGGAASPIITETYTIETDAPDVTVRTPRQGAKNVNVRADVRVTFDEPVTGIDGTTFLLKTGGRTVAAAVTLSSDGRTATLNPARPLAAGKRYAVTLTDGIADGAGNPLAAQGWSFTTKAAKANRR